MMKAFIERNLHSPSLCSSSICNSVISSYSREEALFDWPAGRVSSLEGCCSSVVDRPSIELKSITSTACAGTCCRYDTPAKLNILLEAAYCHLKLYLSVHGFNVNVEVMRGCYATLPTRKIYDLLNPALYDQFCTFITREERNVDGASLHPLRVLVEYGVHLSMTDIRRFGIKRRSSFGQL